LRSVQPRWEEALRRALAELPPGAPLQVKVRHEWPFELPQPSWEREPERARREIGVPRDREEAVATARELAERGQEAAGTAARAGRNRRGRCTGVSGSVAGRRIAARNAAEASCVAPALVQSITAAVTISSTRRRPSSPPRLPSLNGVRGIGFQLSREPS